MKKAQKTTPLQKDTMAEEENIEITVKAYLPREQNSGSKDTDHSSKISVASANKCQYLNNSN